MSEDVLGRIRGDLAVVRRAMGLHLSFGKGMLVFGILLSLAAVSAALVSLLVENDWRQITPLAAIMVLVPVGLFLRSRRNTNLSHDINLQVLVSVTIYAVVWIAACGYTLAAFLGTTIGAARTAGLYATSIGILLAFTLMLVRSALRSRERYYCLGLAISTLLAGMLLPIIDQHYSYPLAHCIMAVGYLTGVAIQGVQLREAVANHAAD
jgi:carbon starvation protein CstA